MLRVEIDGGGSDAPAILGRSPHPFGKGRPGPAAAGAGVDEAVMLGDLDQPLRQIENLTPLEAPRHCPGQERAATAAGRRLMRHDPVGFGCLAKGLAHRSSWLMKNSELHRTRANTASDRARAPHKFTRANDFKVLAALLRNFFAATRSDAPTDEEGRRPRRCALGPRRGQKTGKTKRSFRQAKRNVSQAGS